MATTKRRTLSSFERAFRAAALAELLDDYLRDGTEPIDHTVDPDVICLVAEMLHELLGAPESWEGVRNPEEEQAADDAIAARGRGRMGPVASGGKDVA
jgi:hypothetical protein